jgi:hypothetical protein
MTKSIGGNKYRAPDMIDENIHSAAICGEVDGAKRREVIDHSEETHEAESTRVSIHASVSSTSEKERVLFLTRDAVFELGKPAMTPVG